MASGKDVREALDCVHLCLQKKYIVSIKFDWVKYIVHWTSSGPGWYAGITISRKGSWPRVVMQSRSKEF